MISRAAVLLSIVLATAACRRPIASLEGAAVDVVVEEVQIPVPDGRIPHLAGGLYRGGGPGVLLIQGSGPTDRDWNNAHIPGANGSGAIIARFLARAGFTVLAFDKRGTGKSPADPAATPETPLEDARAVLRFLSTRAGPLVGIFGHSLGTSFGRKIALTGAQVGALVLACGPGRSLRTLLREQITNNVLRPAGVTDPDAVETNLAWFERNLAARHARPDPPAAVHPEVATLAKRFKASPRNQAMIETLDEDPARELARLHTPVLVIGGGRDVQVRRSDYDALVRAAPQGRSLWIADLDHVLKQETRPVTRLSGDEVVARYGEPRPVHPVLLREVCRFLKQHLVGRDQSVTCK